MSDQTLSPAITDPDPDVIAVLIGLTISSA